jgi:hypothetical protein
MASKTSTQTSAKQPRNQFAGMTSRQGLELIAEHAVRSAAAVREADLRYSRSLEDRREAYEAAKAFHGVEFLCEEAAKTLITVSTLTALALEFDRRATSKAEWSAEGEQPALEAARIYRVAAAHIRQLIAAR